MHSGKERAAQTAACVERALTAAGCTATCTEAKDALSPNAEPAGALTLVAASADAPLTVLVGHLPHLHNCATALGVTGITADAFAPAGGVLLESSGSAWSLAHTVLPLAARKDWWIHGVSKYVPAEDDVPVAEEPIS